MRCFAQEVSSCADVHMSSSLKNKCCSMLAFQLALCIGLVHGINTSASDEEYLLARQAQMPLRRDVPDYMERWNEEWAKQLPLNALNQFVALAGRLATPGALGQLAIALLSIFEPSGSSTRALVEIILQWTKDHVEKDNVVQELIKSLNGNVTADLNAVQVEMSDYKIGVERLQVEAMGASCFPSDRFMWCLRALERGQLKGRDALYTIKRSPVKYGAIANYLLAFSSVLTIWREQYELMAFFENWRPSISDPQEAPKEGAMKVRGYIMNSTEVRDHMNRFYENSTATLQDIVDAFWEWRSEKIDFSMHKASGVLKWEDRLTGAKRKLGNNLQAKRDEVQDAAMLVLKRDIFVGELAPMLKSYTTLHRLLPGRSDDPPKREPFFREMIYLGPYSSFIMGAVNTNTKDVAFYIHPDLIEEDAKGSVYKAGGRTGAHVDQLVLFSAGKSGTSVTKIGNEQGGVERERQSLPPFTCGMEIAYHENYMNEIAFMNIKNQSMAIQGLKTSDRAKRWYSGPGLCGLYTLHQFHKYTKPFSFTLGRGIELSFKWEPVTEEDF